MRRVLFGAFIIPLMMFAACEKQNTENNGNNQDDQNNEQQQQQNPEEPQDSEVKTYKNALLPESEMGLSEMEMILSLIEEQVGAIDSDLFNNKLTTELLDCQQRFMLIHDLNGMETDYWSWGNAWDGGTMTYTLRLDDDGTLYYREVCGCADIDFDAYLHDLGYKGYNDTSAWIFEDDTLYTGEDEKYAAQVLYFDGTKAVLEGRVYPMTLYEGEGYKVTSPLELYLFEFKEGREAFLDGFELTAKEFNDLREEYYANNPQ